MRIDHGPGYRVYFARVEQDVVLLLCGGDKRRQSADIDRAVALLRNYEARTA
jgi:putative addiction module killer protein